MKTDYRDVLHQYERLLENPDFKNYAEIYKVYLDERLSKVSFDDAINKRLPLGTDMSGRLFDQEAVDIMIANSVADALGLTNGDFMDWVNKRIEGQSVQE